MRRFLWATVVINYKSELRTVKFVREELLGKCASPQVIVVVNNGATEETSSMLSQTLCAPIVRDIGEDVAADAALFILHNTKNSGFAKGNNLGIDFVMKHFQVDYFLFSNNDIVLRSERVVESLVTRISQLPDVGIIGPKIVGLDGACQSPYIYLPFWTYMMRISWERFLPFKKRYAFDLNQAEEGYYYRLMGSFMLVRRDDFIRCGGMDGRTFLYGEELILTERMLAVHKRAYYYPGVTVLHEHGQTIGRYVTLVRNHYMRLRSALYYFRTYKHVGVLSVVAAYIVVSLYIWMQAIFRNFKTLKH